MRKSYDWCRLLQGSMEMLHQLVKFASDPYVTREITERHPVFSAIVTGSEVLLERYKECEDLVARQAFDEATEEPPRPAYLYSELHRAITSKLEDLSEETKKITGIAYDQEVLQFFELLWEKQWWEDRALRLHKMVDDLRDPDPDEEIPYQLTEKGKAYKGIDDLTSALEQQTLSEGARAGVEEIDRSIGEHTRFPYECERVHCWYVVTTDQADNAYLGYDGPYWNEEDKDKAVAMAEADRSVDLVEVIEVPVKLSLSRAHPGTLPGEEDSDA